MTKKHFIEIADAIRMHNRVEDSPDKDNEAFTDRQLHTLADAFAGMNPAFNRGRWLSYVRGECDPNGGKIG